MEDMAAVVDTVHVDIFLYDTDIVNGSMIWEYSRKSVGKHPTTVRLLRYNSHNHYVSNINTLFKAYSCQSCDELIKKAYDRERYLTTCKERVKYVFPYNVYQLRGTLFDKLDSFKIPYSDDHKLFKSKAIFVFESVRVQEDKFCDTDTARWVGKHVPISVSISSKIIEHTIFLCNFNPAALVEFLLMLLMRSQHGAKRK